MNLILTILLPLFSAFSLSAESLGKPELLNLQFEQRLNAYVPLELMFTNQVGAPVQLGKYFGARPAILLLGYYGCPMLCGLVLNGVVEALQDMRAAAGQDFDLIFVSIDPREAPELAQAKRQVYLKRYGRPGSDTGWHFLVGGEPEIKSLCDAVGFHYAYDSSLQDMQRVPGDALEIQIVGKQWMWKAQHPTGNREIDELHVPVGRNIRLTLASQDVIHSFFVPAFRIKQDVVPGRYTTQWFMATRIGTYHLFCAEYCGNSHSQMLGRVHVISPVDYQEWLMRGKPAEPIAESGARLFRELGCSGCHAGNATVRAPPLEGLFERPVPLMSGEVVTADEQYVHDSILQPNRDIVAGYEPLMPSYEGRITQEQVFELVAYIKSLATEKPITHVNQQRGSR